MRAFIVPICNDDHSLIMMSFALENTLSALEDIAEIEKISIAINNKRANLDADAKLQIL